MTTLKGTQSVVLEDLSAQGARLGCKGEMPSVGAEVVIEWGKYEGFGAVLWTKSNTFGVQFFDPIENAVVIATRDMDDEHRLPGEREQNRRAASAFVNGK